MTVGRWISNTSVFIVCITALAASSIVLSWLLPAILSSATVEKSEAEEIELTLVEGSGAQKTLSAVRSLDSGSAGARANRGLERSLCSSPGTDPVASVSIAFGEDNESQAVVMALPPGAGTWVAESIGDSLGRCLNEDTSEVSWLPSWARSADHQGSEVIVWSRGDFVVTFDGNSKDARTLDDTLVSALNEFECLNLSPLSDDHYMNPAVVGEDQYRPPVKVVTVTAEDAPIEDSEGNIREAPLSSDIPYPGREVVRPEIPEGREYWPDLPEELEYPDIPVIDVRPPNSESIEVPVHDVDGPGCGWVFFSYQVIESEAVTEAEERVIVDTARRELEDEHDQWSAFAGEFWDNYDTYVTLTEEYRAYREEVEEVADFWRMTVAPLWDEYEADLVLWEGQMAELQEWESRRQEAQNEWDRHLATCTERAAVNPTPPPWQDSTSPPPSPTPDSSVIYCDDVDEPEILSEQPPEVMDEPERPVRPEE